MLAPICPAWWTARDTQELSNAYKQQLGSSITSQIGYTLAYNTLDENKNPSRGVIARLNQDLAGLGGDAEVHPHDG